MRHPAVEPTVAVVSHAGAPFCQNRLPLGQALALEVFNEVRLPRGVDPAFLEYRQPEGFHAADPFLRSCNPRRKASTSDDRNRINRADTRIFGRIPFLASVYTVARDIPR